MSETFDEAVERLRRETRLNEEIEELARYLDRARNSPGLGYMFTGAQLAVLIDQLRELRARRLAMGRAADDEVNAPADMCCCNVNLQGAPVPWFRGGCPLHPAPLLQPGWQADNCRGQTIDNPPCGGCERCLSEQYGTGWDDDDIDWEAGPPVRPEPYPPPFKRRPPTVRELNEADDLDPMVLDLPLLPDGPGEHGEPAWARGAPMPGDPSLDCDGAPCRYLGGGECEPVTCPVATGERDPEAIAQRLMGELGPELAAAVCVQLLGRLPRREP